MIKEISRKTANEEGRNGESIRSNNRDSKINEWLKPQEKPEIIEDTSNKTNYIKYFIIGGTIIIVTSLGWYYWEDVKSTSQSLIEWYFSSI